MQYLAKLSNPANLTGAVPCLDLLPNRRLCVPPPVNEVNRESQHPWISALNLGSHHSFAASAARCREADTLSSGVRDPGRCR
jgi:hypothetical protein